MMMRTWLLKRDEIIPFRFEDMTVVDEISARKAMKIQLANGKMMTMSGILPMPCIFQEVTPLG